MSITVFARRSPLALGLLLCGLLLPAPVVASSLDVILENYWILPNLEFANANKIALGKFNRLHAVFANQDPQSPTSDIVYVHFDPLEPYNPWSEFWLTYDGLSSEPALAVDNGLAVVVWVSRPSAASSLGSIYYSYQTQQNCPVQYTCWSQPQQIVFLGAEPSVAATGGNVHLTWTTRDRVQYATFPRTSPPSTPLWLGEVVDFTNCPNTRFAQPSIAFVHVPCQSLKVKIASLFTASEQSSGGPCQDSDTHVGPRVYERDANTQTWSTVFQDVVSEWYQQDPAAVSISLNANRLTGDFYLAWSDEQNGTPETWVGHGSGVNWDAPQLVDSQRHHVHVAAKSGGSAGHFRLAVGEEGWSTAAYTRTGQWNGGLTWTAGPAAIADGTYPLVGHPQALYWRRCVSSQLTERTAYTQASGWNPGNPPIQLAASLSQSGPVSCLFTGGVLTVPDCYQTRLAIGQVVLVGGREAVVVDLDDTAVLTRVSETGAEIASLGGGTIQVTWAPGEVLASSESGFVVATSRDSVRFSSRDAEFSVEDEGRVGTYGGK